MARNIKTGNDHEPAERAVSPRVVTIVVAVVIVVIATIAWFWQRPASEPEPVPEPGPARTIERVAPAQSGAERGDSAREFIAELRANSDDIDYAEAYARAQSFRQAGRFADAQLLYFFAAQGGDGRAAFDLATFYDPTRDAAEGGLMVEPDPFQAYKWYRQARDAGQEDAADRLRALRAWAEDAARAGDADAERLLLQWESGS